MSNKSGELTNCQQETLDWIVGFIQKNGMPPTVREIGRAFNIKSSSAHARLKYLERKGYVRRGNLGARSLIVENKMQPSNVSIKQEVKNKPEKLNTSKLRPPFRYQDLLPTHLFLHFCRRRGINIRTRDLNYYETENILLPALKADLEYIRNCDSLRKLYGEEQGKYSLKDMKVPAVSYRVHENEADYHFGGVSDSSSDWLSKYQEKGFTNKLLKTEDTYWGYLTEDKFGAQGSVGDGEKQLGKQERFYVRHQIFLIRYIQACLTLRITNKSLFGSDEEWIRTGRFAKEVFVGAPNVIRKKIYFYYETFVFLNSVRDLIDEMFDEAQKVYDESFKDCENKKEALKDARSCIERLEKTSVLRRAKAILKKSGFSEKEIIGRRNIFLNEIKNYDPIARWFPYLDSIPQKLIGTQRGDYRYALDCYGIVNQLGWVLEMIGCKPQTITEKLLGTEEYKICSYCGEYFKLRNRRQKTCGKSRCAMDHKNSIKRIRRSMGL